MGEFTEIFLVTMDAHFLQSYGGFMSAKIAEANAKVHSLAMSVAVSFGPRNGILASFDWYLAGCQLETLW